VNVGWTLKRWCRSSGVDTREETRGGPRIFAFWICDLILFTSALYRFSLFVLFSVPTYFNFYGEWQTGPLDLVLTSLLRFIERWSTIMSGMMA
jgi:hypothetical protein